MLLQGLQGAASGKAQLDGNRSAAPRLRDARQLAQLFGAGELAAGKDFLDKATNAPGVHSPEMGCAPRELKAVPQRLHTTHQGGASRNISQAPLRTSSGLYWSATMYACAMSASGGRSAVHSDMRSNECNRQSRVSETTTAARHTLP